MAKTVKPKAVKKPKGLICDICHNECGSLHTVFSEPPERKEIKGIKQCCRCLGGLTK